MNIVKIQTNLISAIINKKDNNCNYQVMDDKVALIMENHIIYFINKKQFLIDLEKWDKAPLSTINKIMESSTYDEAHLSGEMRYIEKFKMTIVKIENDKAHVWINEKLLKLFDKERTFRITNRKSPVYIYEGEELVGCILPVNAKEDEENGSRKKL